MWILSQNTCHHWFSWVVDFDICDLLQRDVVPVTGVCWRKHDIRLSVLKSACWYRQWHVWDSTVLPVAVKHTKQCCLKSNPSLMQASTIYHHHYYYFHSIYLPSYSSGLLRLLILLKHGASWNPHFQKDKDKLEKVNRWAARFVVNKYEQQAVSLRYSKTGMAIFGTLSPKPVFCSDVQDCSQPSGTVAVPSSSIVPADPRTRTHHNYKFRTITTNTSQQKNWTPSFLTQFLMERTQQNDCWEWFLWHF